LYLILVVPLSILVIILCQYGGDRIKNVAAYLCFFICPSLTFFGEIGVLTGFNDIFSNKIYFGISFYSLVLSYSLIKNREFIMKGPFNFFLTVINPIYLFTGPFPLKVLNRVNILNFRIFFKRLKLINSDLILGFFFSFVLAPSFQPLLYLKDKFNPLEIILFGIFFELYVYFNFAGFSMIAWSLLRLLGFQVKRNFNQPFSATSLVEYWQRWHISLSFLLKELFYYKFRRKYGLYFSVFVVFIASSLWHGVTLNFILWGLFHSIFWCVSHYFHKIKSNFLNYFLLVVVIIIGRIIFSEIDSSILIDKLILIFNFSQWRLDLNEIFIFLNLSYVNKINLLLGFSFVILEIVLSKKYYAYRNNYNYLRNPFISTIILIYFFLVFNGLLSNPIYGIR
jgi:D-alanyl-lipoteichoic acid acyltransferase DltB (MBOAT superfamily)